jgi:hypothetical protein
VINDKKAASTCGVDLGINIDQLNADEICEDSAV